MTKRPPAVIVISILFLVVGVLGVVHQAISLNARGMHRSDAVLALLVELFAVIGAAFVLRAANWARWLLTLWMAFHVILSAFHTLRELVIHVALFAVIAFFLFRPSASAYFRGDRPSNPDAC